MAAKALRAVGPDEPAPKQAPKSVAEAAAGGNHLELLISMRDRIAKAVANESCPPRDLAALTRRLQDIAAEIKSLQEADVDDDAGPAEDHFDASAI